ncbi:MAG: DHH family phosphoesterase [Phycisphaerales bacterium]|nr:DHH family phosphoesterase [Phycisphaerales bacterium]
MSYTTTSTLAAVGRRIADARRIAITTHSKVDGDALGSVLALSRALRATGHETDALIMGPVEPNLLALTREIELRAVDVTPPDDAPDAYDLVLVVDTGSWSQLAALKPWLVARRDRVIVLDHHPRGDDVSDVRIVDTGAASATMIVAELFETMDLALTPDVAEALFMGLATDTGWFRHSNADARAFARAATLLEAGVDKAALYARIESNYQPTRLHLLGRALRSLELHRDDTVAVMSLGLSDFKETGGGFADLPGLVNMPLDIGSVRTSIFLTQTEPGMTKLSFRSKPTPPGAAADAITDVNRLAGHFGGGGHVHAAGARVGGDIESTRKELMHAIRRIDRGAE